MVVRLFCEVSAEPSALTTFARFPIPSSGPGAVSISVTYPRDKLSSYLRYAPRSLAGLEGRGNGSARPALRLGSRGRPKYIDSCNPNTFTSRRFVLGFVNADYSDQRVMFSILLRSKNRDSQRFISHLEMVAEIN